MGKQKTHKAAVKRFKITKKGKLLHRSPFARHLHSVKSKRQLRSLRRLKQVKGRAEKKLKRLLAIK